MRTTQYLLIPVTLFWLASASTNADVALYGEIKNSDETTNVFYSCRGTHGYAGTCLHLTDLVYSKKINWR